MNHLARIITATAWLALCYACAPAPIYRPIKVGDVDTGANSVEAVRRQFQGTWTLDNYYVYEGARRRRLDAAAEMVYDEFGNLKMRGELKHPGAAAGTPPVLLNFSGRAVIDANTRQLRLMAVNSTGDAIPSAIADQVNPASMRHYEFQGSNLWLTINGANGTPTASSSWKKSR
jgi:hypothetical protein